MPSDWFVLDLPVKQAIWVRSLTDIILLHCVLLCVLQVARDASSEGPVEDPLLEGGGTPEERQASFLELALCLAAGLPDSALDPLFVVSTLFNLQMLLQLLTGLDMIICRCLCKGICGGICRPD
jgi:hypothetical protein